MNQPKHLTAGFRGTLLNPPDGGGIVSLVGKFIVNFGGIELMSLAWISVLAEDPLLIDTAIDMPLSRRLDLLKSLVTRQTTSKKWIRGATQAWDDVKRLSKTRNVIAHGPVAYVWQGREPKGEADLVAIPELKHLKSAFGGKMPTISLATLKAKVDESAATGEALQVLYDELVVARQPKPAKRGRAT